MVLKLVIRIFEILIVTIGIRTENLTNCNHFTVFEGDDTTTFLNSGNENPLFEVIKDLLLCEILIFRIGDFNRLIEPPCCAELDVDFHECHLINEIQFHAERQKEPKDLRHHVHGFRYLVVSNAAGRSLISQLHKETQVTTFWAQCRGDEPSAKCLSDSDHPRSALAVCLTLPFIPAPLRRPRRFLRAPLLQGYILYLHVKPRGRTPVTCWLGLLFVAFLALGVEFGVDVIPQCRDEVTDFHETVLELALQALACEEARKL